MTQRLRVLFPSLVGDGDTGRRNLLGEGLAVVGGFAALTVIMTYPLAREITRALPSDLGDPLLSTWILAWDADRLQHGLQGLWNAPIFYPYPHTLAYSEHLLGLAILTAPVQWLSGNPVLAYNLAFLFSYVLAGSGMYLLARSVTGSRLAAVVVGLAFAFLPYRASQLSHLQVLMYGWMPVGLWALHRFFVAGSGRALAVFVITFLLLGLSNGYYLYYFALPVVAVVVFELLRRRESRGRRIMQLALASMVTVLVLAPVILAYYQARQDQGLLRPRAGLLGLSADVNSYLHGSPSLVVWGDILSRVRAEAELFPGAVLFSLAILGVVTVSMGRRVGDRGSRSVRAVAFLYAGIGAAAFVLTLGPEPTAWGYQLLSSGPYDWLLAIVPGLDGLRVPARMVVVVYLALSVLAAVGIAAALDRVSPRVGMIACVVLSIVVVAEGYGGPMPYARFEPELDGDDVQAYAWLQTAPPGSVLELPIVGDEPVNTTTYQYHTLQHKHPIVNGYSGYPSRLFLFLTHPGSPLFEPDQFDDVLQACRGLGIRYIVVHESRFRRIDLARATSAAIRQHTDQLSGIAEFGATTVFWLARQDPPTEGAPGLQRVPRSGFTARASHENERLDRAFDEDLDTRWLSGQPQNGTEWIEVRFDRVRNVGRVRLDMADRGLSDYPRGLLIESSEDGQEFQALYEGEVLSQLLQGRVRNVDSTPIDIILPDDATSLLRIRQTDRTGALYWSIFELSLWER